jgi:hypothetical protein
MGGAQRILPIDLDINAGARLWSPDLYAWLSHTPTLLNGYISVTAFSTDGQIAVFVNALFATQRADAVSVAYPLRVCWQREKTNPATAAAKA